MSKVVKIGSISFNPEHPLGKGLSSIVFRGKFGDRDVAVKRVDKSNVKLMEKEIKLLQESDAHPNIIRYFHTEEDDKFFYIALELCLWTLNDYVENKELKSRIAMKQIVDQLFSGITSLHALTIVHRDIKPTNILLMENAQKELVVKISDFGFAKEMKDSDSQMSIADRGSIYWTIPEMAKNKYNAKSDVFSAGRIVHYIAMNGSVDPKEVTWRPGFNNTPEKVAMKHLVTMMTRENPEQRPPFQCLVQHPFFWENQKIINFLVAAADRLKRGNENDELSMKTKGTLEENSEIVIGRSWYEGLEDSVKRSLGRGRIQKNYNENLICELLRGIRNMTAHYNEQSQESKATFGPMPDGFTNYWIGKFPQLLMHVYITVHKTGLFRDINFSQFYLQNSNCVESQN